MDGRVHRLVYLAAGARPNFMKIAPRVGAWDLRSGSLQYQIVQMPRYGAVSLHRPSNADGREAFTGIIAALNPCCRATAADLFRAPVHPGQSTAIRFSPRAQRCSDDTIVVHGLSEPVERCRTGADRQRRPAGRNHRPRPALSDLTVQNRAPHHRGGMNQHPDRHRPRYCLPRGSGRPCRARQSRQAPCPVGRSCDGTSFQHLEALL